MLARFQRLNISLAAKCQILFGAAVVLIIAAALFVPWQRMDGLMEDINQRAADTLVHAALTQHEREQRAARDAPTTRPAVATWPATTQPTAGDEPAPYGQPLLVPAHALEDLESLTSFQRRAFRDFLTGRRLTYASYYDLPDGGTGYRYARALYLDTSTSCLSCHTDPGPLRSTRARDIARASVFTPPLAPTTVPTTGPATAPTTVPAGLDPAETRGEPLADILPENFIGMVTVQIPSQVPTSQYLLNRVFLLTAGLLAGSLAIVVFYLITTKLILQPVRVLQETAEKVSEGNLNIRSHIHTGDEFQQLSETFNTMLANLQATEKELRAINRNLDLKLNQLAESNLALYESNRLKSEFLANVSHELRTPLNSILGFAELLADAAEKALDSKSQRYVQNITRSGRHLLELINDLLDLAKIEAGRMEVRVEPLSLPDLFEGLAGILKPLLEPNELSIVQTIARDVPILHTDPAKLQQVLYNFLSNAIKFSPRGGVVTLAAVREDAQHIRISVTDRGPGIDPSMHKVIFEKFRQIDSSMTRAYPGTGLGLAISKELSELLGGRIGVTSTPGQGATFWIIIPLKIAPTSADMKDKLILAT